MMMMIADILSQLLSVVVVFSLRKNHYRWSLFQSSLSNVWRVGYVRFSHLRRMQLSQHSQSVGHEIIGTWKLQGAYTRSARLRPSSQYNRWLVDTSSYRRRGVLCVFTHITLCILPQSVHRLMEVRISATQQLQLLSRDARIKNRGLTKAALRLPMYMLFTARC